MKSLMIAAVSFASLLALAGPAAAQAFGPRSPVVNGEKRIVIDMEADVIEGTLKAPDVVVIPEPTHRKFRSLIQVRSDFRREILTSGAQL
ncbi:MAG: hypothetical protein A2138_00435 [Deltaproteobacteria bacterium RBG_16_71_12]|nr:MAG: hypothetical protein A2138_00435 [Deltaproteobacteria bacterium RBG_16_71_12]